MIIDFSNYYYGYHKESENLEECNNIPQFLKDNWQDCVKLLPFTSNPSSDIYDKNCGLLGVVGEFVRLCEQIDSNQISNFNNDIVVPVKNYLSNKYKLSDGEIEKIITVLKDILWNANTLNIVDSNFLKYIPILSDINNSIPGYSAGVVKMAQYAYSLLENANYTHIDNNATNLFTKIIKGALAEHSTTRVERNIKYNVQKYIREMFTKDYSWLLKQEDSIIIKYFPLFLHFYICFSITQSIVSLSPEKANVSNSPELFYFILNSEKSISMNSEAVLQGWPNKIIKPKILEKLFGRVQALDIANTCLGGTMFGFYPEVLAQLKETDFEENKLVCEQILKNYQKDKRFTLEKRKSEKLIPQCIDDLSVSSYEMFLNKLHNLCIRFQSCSYDSRLKKKVLNLMGVRFLQNHGKSGYILCLDDEMLIFLIALITKGDKIRLDNLYKLFKHYGIGFNINTRRKIEDLLLKLNILDKKSDSGEAQYVRIIL